MRLKGIVEYSQPDFYHFSEDSLFLVEGVLPYIEKQLRFKKSLDILDLCAGCGVIGLEILTRFPDEVKMDFCEVQSEFKPHFDKNLKILEEEAVLQSHYSICSYSDISKKYDVIVSNPPYFFADEGRLPSNNKTQKCRFTQKSDWGIFLSRMAANLKPTGESFFLGRNPLLHLLDKKWSIKEVGRLSETGLFLMTILNEK